MILHRLLPDLGDVEIRPGRFVFSLQHRSGPCRPQRVVYR